MPDFSSGVHHMVDLKESSSEEVTRLSSRMAVVAQKKQLTAKVE